jgi:RNA polymerase sigma-70 factor (ECF subfamily)
MVSSEVPIATPSLTAPPVVGGLPVAERSQSAGEHSDPDTMDRPQRLALTEQLLGDHYDRVYRYAFHLLGCRTSAEDIAQEVFARAFAHAHQLRSREAAVGWLLAIARNEVARWCGRSVVVQSPDLDPASSCHHEQQLEDHEWIHWAVQQLPFEFRQVVLMYYFEQKSYLEIAEALELPMGTVMSRLNRARSQLKDRLNAASDPSSPNAKQDLVKKESKR